MFIGNEGTILKLLNIFLEIPEKKRMVFAFSNSHIRIINTDPINTRYLYFNIRFVDFQDIISIFVRNILDLFSLIEVERRCFKP